MSQQNATVQFANFTATIVQTVKNRVNMMRVTKENRNLNCKRNRNGEDSQVESPLKLWLTNVREKDAHVDRPLMKQKVEELAKNGKDYCVATEEWKKFCFFF